MTSSYRGIPVSKAGERFGLSLEDLEELFQMRETGQPEGEGDQFGLPLTKTEFTEKGRGGVMGYKAARTPTVTKTLGGAERAAVNVSNIFKPTNQMTTPAAEQKEPAAPAPQQFAPLRSFIGAQGDPTKTILGAAATQRALQAGMTTEQLREAATKEGVGFSPEAAPLVGVPVAKQFLSQYIGPAGTAGYLGAAAVERARSAGLSDPEIKTFAAAQNLQFGSDVDFNKSTSAPAAPAPSPNLSSFIGPAGTQGFLGAAAVDRARSTGLSDEQIRQLAAQQGLAFGGDVRLR